ncbi:uncharacterized protein A1O9_10852, partial [Exophiala aquamarina CBS 119918]
GAEIQEYWKTNANRYGLQGLLKLNHRVVDADWPQTNAKWICTFTDHTDFLVTATGHLSDPRLPRYPGNETFQGHLRQTSLWDPKFDNGSSGLQVL